MYVLVLSQKMLLIFSQVNRSRSYDECLFRTRARSELEIYEGVPLVRLPDSAQQVDGVVNALRKSFNMQASNLRIKISRRICEGLSLRHAAYTSNFLLDRSSSSFMTELRSELLQDIEQEIAKDGLSQSTNSGCGSDVRRV